MDAVELEGKGGGCGGVELELVVAAVLGDLEAREGGAEQDFKRLPIFGLGEGGGHALDGMSEKTDFWEAAQDPALRQNNGAVEMADDGALDLIGASAN